MIVVDASALAAVMFLEPEAPRLVAALADERWHAPAVLPFELTNIARTKTKQRPGQAALIEEALADMLAQPITYQPVDFSAVLEIRLTADGGRVFLTRTRCGHRDGGEHGQQTYGAMYFVSHCLC